MIIVKSPQEIEAMRRAGAIVGQFFEEITRYVKPGVATLHLEEIAEEYVAKHGVKGAFKGYLGYPANLCTSINEEVVHGIPSGTRVLREGDIVSIDFGVVLNGFYGDAARTYAVGRISPDSENLLKATERALGKGIGHPCRGTGWGIFPVPSRRKRKAQGSPSSGTSWDTGSEGRCTRNHRSPTSEPQESVRSSCREWCWPSSP